MAVKGLILSGGASSRMGFPKALIEVNGRTLLQDQVIRFNEAGIQDVYVVVGAHEKEIKEAHPDLDVTWIVNQDWEDGKFSSVLCGLSVIARRPLPAGRQGSNPVLLLPIDVISVPVDVFRKIIQEGTKTAHNIIPTYKEKGGHPVFLSSRFVQHILESCTKDDRLDHQLKECKCTSYLHVETDSVLSNVNEKGQNFGDNVKFSS